jgi:diadenosine tetraphosphate (Ap4A) HIT family hydrolase
MKKLFFILLFQVVLFADECPFCKPEILEKQMVLDGKECCMLYCLTPLVTGNVLVIPKRHVEGFENLSASEIEEIRTLIAKLPNAYQKAYGSTDYFIMQKNGVLAGQSEKHLHFHVFPTPVPIQQIFIKSLKPIAPIADEEMHLRRLELTNAIQ